MEKSNNTNNNNISKIEVNPETKQVNKTTVSDLNILNLNIEKNNIFEDNIKLFLENIGENINKLIIFIKNNYKGNENILRKYFLTKISDDKYKLNYYNNAKLKKELNAKILFGDYDSLKRGNRRYYKNVKTGDFKDKSGNKLLIYKNSIISTSFLDISKDGLNIDITFHNKNFLLEYVGSKIIYLTIDGKQYGEFSWDIKANKYILQDHKDGKVALEIKKGKKYTITLNDKVINNTYESLLSGELDKEEIEKLYSLFSKNNENIEKIKDEIISYLNKQIELNNLNLKDDEYIYYIDKLIQASFLINYNSGNLEIIGYDRISSGNPKRNSRKSKKRYFETPNLLINRNDKISNKSNKRLFEGDWRAEGTNGKGYGKEGSKIFNLGKYYVDKNGIAYLINNQNEDGTTDIIINGKKVKVFHNFHFAMHKTTSRGTTKLGTKLSQGCIRSTPFSIDLLDSQKILDGKKGKYIIIGNYKD